MTAVGDLLAMVSRAVSDDRSQLRQARVQAGQENHAPWRGGVGGVDRVHLLAGAASGPRPAGAALVGWPATVALAGRVGMEVRFFNLAVLPGNPCGARGQGDGADATRRGRGWFPASL